MHGPSCSLACGIIPRAGIKSMPPALAGGFLSTGPPRKSYNFLLIFSIIWRFSLCSSILLLRSVDIFMTDTLNSLSDKLFIFVSLKSFAGDFLCSLVWNQYLCLLIWCTYVCLSITGKMVPSSSLEEVVLCRCFMWLGNKSHQSQAFYGHPLHGLHVPTIFSRATGWAAHRKFAWSSCSSAAVRGGFSLRFLSSPRH